MKESKKLIEDEDIDCVEVLDDHELYCKYSHISDYISEIEDHGLLNVVDI